MNEQQPEHTPEQHEMIGVRTVRSHQFFMMVVGVIVVSLFLVYVAMSLYRSSGAVQLDLSRPGYDTAREEATKDNSKVFEGFSADGTIDKQALEEFERLYKQKSDEALVEMDAFSGDALSDQALALDKD